MEGGEEEEEEGQLPTAKPAGRSSPSLGGLPREVTDQRQPSQSAAVEKLGPNDLLEVLTELLLVSAVWENIGLALRLAPGTLDALKAPFKRPEDCLRDTLKEWLNTSPDPSWKGLTQALKHPVVGKGSLARQLERFKGTMEVLEDKPSVPDTPLSPMELFVKSLKAEYERVSAASDRDYPAPTSVYTNLAVVRKEIVSQAEADKFTRTTLHGGIDEIMQKKQPIALENVFTPEDGQQVVKYVLAEGAPGVGKSTIALELCRRWDSIARMRRFVAVVLLRLREKRVQEAKTVADLFYHDSPGVQETVTEWLSSSSGENVLLVLDGFDELPAHLRESNLLAQVIRGRCLQNTTILVTNRPSARADLLSLRPQPDKHTEVLGFTSELVDQYAESVFGKDVALLADFRMFINANPPVKSMMYIPLNSAIVVEIYREYRTEGRPIPHTMTQLYTELTLIRLRSYLREQRNWPVDRLPVNLEDLPEEIREELISLAKLAFEAYMVKEVIFESLPANCSTLGLMTASQELYLGRRGAVNYNFFHLTHQEFLAAFHISQLPVSEQKDIFLQCVDMRKYEDKPPEMSVVWRFVAGLTGFGDIGWDKYKPWLGRAVKNTLPIESMDKEYFVEEEAVDKEEGGIDVVVTPFIAQCLYETQEKVDYGKMLGVSKATFDCSWRSCSVLDFFAVGYCVAASKCFWNIDLRGNWLNFEKVETLVCGLQSSEEVCGSIGSLRLSGGLIRVELLRKLPHRILQGMSYLGVAGCKLDSKDFDLLSSVVPIMTSLKELRISNNSAVHGGTVTLLKALSESNQLHSLHMHFIDGVGPDDFAALSLLIQPSVGSLNELVIGDWKMSAEKVKIMLEIVLSPSSLEHLTLCQVHWCSSSIASLLKDNRNLIKLTLYECHYGDEVVSSIAKALRSQSTLREFTLLHAYGTTDSDVVIAFSEMITLNQTLRKLTIFTQSTISEEAARALVGAMKTNQGLEQLKLLCSGFERYFSDSELKKLDTRVVLNDYYTP